MDPLPVKHVSVVVPVPVRAAHLPVVTRVLNRAPATKHKVGFEGGQMPLQRRLPKFGFKNINRVEYKAINIETLQTLAESKNLDKITVADLRAAGFVSGKDLVKILANGAITRAIAVEANAFSKAAEKAIVDAGGSISKI